MIPSNRETALTKALEFYKLTDGAVETVIETAETFLKFLDGPGPEDEIATYQARADFQRPDGEPLPTWTGQ